MKNTYIVKLWLGMSCRYTFNKTNKKEYMKKSKYIVLALLLAIASSAFSQKVPQKSFLLCGDTKVLLVDYMGSKDTIPKIIWEWDSRNAKDIDEPDRKKFRSMDDCKAVNKGERILVSSSSGAVAVIERKNKKVLFYTSVPNAHSIELLPDGFLAAAASTNKDGNKVLLFKINNQNETLFSDSLHSAHGLVWDNKRESLFALGYNVLREYKLIKKGNPKLLLKREWRLPHDGGHDLQMAPDNDKLFVTIERSGAWEFNLNSQVFGKIKGFPDSKIIKSIGQNNAGQYIFTIPEESWWTFHVKFFNPDRSFSFPGLRVYKARWFSK